MELIPDSNPILHIHALSVTDDTMDKALAAMELFPAMMETHNGMGLAAPQVGISLRFFVINYGGRTYNCINPEIIKWDTKTDVGNEGCLSYPTDLPLPITRTERIKVRYTDATGKKCTHYMQGTMARVFQHELDHLNGITYLDRYKSERPNSDIKTSFS